MVSDYVHEVGSQFFVYADSETEQGRQRQIEVFRDNGTGEFFYDREMNDPVFLPTKNQLNRQIDGQENRNTLNTNLEAQTLVEDFFANRNNLITPPTMRLDKTKKTRIDSLKGGGFILHQGKRGDRDDAYNTRKNLGVYPTKALAEKAREHLIRNPDMFQQRQQATQQIITTPAQTPVRADTVQRPDTLQTTQPQQHVPVRPQASQPDQNITSEVQRPQELRRLSHQRYFMGG
jgi:hypothetical protein